MVFSLFAMWVASLALKGKETLFDDGKGLQFSLPASDIEGSKSIVFRPQNLSLCDAGSESADLQGEVKIREFLGNIVHYEIRVGQQNVIVDEVYGLGKKPDETGSQVGLQMYTNHIMVMN